VNLEAVLRPRRRPFDRARATLPELLDRVAHQGEAVVLTHYALREDGALVEAGWVDLLAYAYSEPYLHEMVARIEEPSWAAWDGAVCRRSASRGRDLRGRLRGLLDDVRAAPGAAVDVWWREEARVALVSVRLLQRVQALVAQPEVFSAVYETWRMAQAAIPPKEVLRLIG